MTQSRPTIVYALLLQHMESKRYSIMETQHNLARVVRDVETGYEVEITRRKRPVARLVPVDAEEPIDFPDFTGRAQCIWKGQWSGLSSNELVDEGRGER